jgi:hypothetical protein
MGKFQSLNTLKITLYPLAKTQFPKRKIGMLLFWASLLLPLLTGNGRNIPAFARDTHILSLQANPQLLGPENRCIVFGSVLGTYSAGGAAGDVYDWEVTNASGEVLLARSGGIQFETIQVVFREIGNYAVRLSARRGTQTIYRETLAVVVQKGPDEIALLPDYLLCAGSPALITALNPGTPNLSQYTIEWKDMGGNVLGTENEFLGYSA